MYLLSNSTILNNRVATYFINSTKLLVPRSFKLVNRVEVIKVGSIVVLILGKEAYLFKNVLYSKYILNTKNLLL